MCFQFSLPILLSFFAMPLASATAAPVLKHYHYVSETLHVDGTEVPMFGKANEKFVNIGDDPNPHRIWVTRISTQIYDQKTNEPLPDYLCHSHLSENAANGWMSSRFFGNHGGAADTQLTDGFAVPIEMSEKKPAMLYGMVADYGHRGLKKDVRVEIDFDYYDEKDALKLGIRPLEISMVFGESVNDAGGTLMELEKKTDGMHDHHSDPMHDKLMGRYNHFHWFVKPGRFTFRTPLNKQVAMLKENDIRVFHIHAHVHPYAEYQELYDKTDKKVIFHGKAETFPDRSVVKSVEHYDDKKGFVLKKDHQYEMVVVYNNPKKTPISAMVTWRLFFQREPMTSASR